MLVTVRAYTRLSSLAKELRDLYLHKSSYSSNRNVIKQLLRYTTRESKSFSFEERILVCFQGV